jgi:hypothetical protein
LVDSRERGNMHSSLTCGYFCEQNEAFEREKLARVAAQAERRAAAEEGQRAMAQLRQEAAAHLQHAHDKAEERERQLRYTARPHLLQKMLARSQVT